MRPIAIVVTGDPVPSARTASGTFSEMIRRSVGEAWSGPWLDAEARDGSELPDPESLAAILVTGSSASVTERAPWMLAIESYLVEAVRAETPVFGICFGHQLLGQALGGRVELNPKGRQIGTVDASVRGSDPLLEPELRPRPRSGAPSLRALSLASLAEEQSNSGQLFSVNTTHRDAVVELPPAARVIGSTPRDPHAFVRFGERAWGVQFHPEFDRTTMRAYISERREILTAEGFEVDALLERVSDAVPGREVMKRFVARYALR